MLLLLKLTVLLNHLRNENSSIENVKLKTTINRMAARHSKGILFENSLAKNQQTF